MVAVEADTAEAEELEVDVVEVEDEVELEAVLRDAFPASSCPYL